MMSPGFFTLDEMRTHAQQTLHVLPNGNDALTHKKKTDYIFQSTKKAE